MREILFRGKTSGNEWVYGNLSVIGDVCFISADMGFNKTVIPKTIGQYTGLTDKNGTKIFEGDILKGSWNTVFVVYYDECYLQFRAKKAGGYTREMDYYGESKDCEIIGNIHDNPELMN